MKGGGRQCEGGGGVNRKGEKCGGRETDRQTVTDTHRDRESQRGREREIHEGTNSHWREK